jgi:hypothetical protein
MRSLPEDDYDRKELERLNAEPWMLEALALNPSYVYWGPHEDYMMAGEDSGWRAPMFMSSWSEVMTLDVLNECVNFYFQIVRDSDKCESCDQSGYNPATKRIADDFYDFAETGRRWRDAITQDEVNALQECGRLTTWNAEAGAWERKPLTAEQVNAGNRRGAGGPFAVHNHDAINRSILIETRATRLGVYGHCPKCDGHGYVYTSPAAHLSLVLWIIHPRKGASRGVEIKNLSRDDFKSAVEWLAGAARRNADRFSKVTALS